MEENKKMDWLEGQTITIPVSEFIEMRLEMAEQKRKEDELYHRVWDAEEKLRDSQKIIQQYKADMERLLGITELEKVRAEQEDA